jgi:hypothetical protein
MSPDPALALADLYRRGPIRLGATGQDNQQRPPQAALSVQRLLGKLNTVPSRTPADGQRCVMVLRLV